ncbi:MAG: hypothetical protein IBX47_12550, partial [Desulfuromonadales bacterium]|nr:hypothetical protein [Desulfuromonadales bacterium]
SQTAVESSALNLVAQSTTIAATDAAPKSLERHYRVTALDAVGNESSFSDETVITFPVAPIRDLVLTRIEEGSPTLTWSAGEAGLAGYILYRNGQPLNADPTQGTSFADGLYTLGSVTYGVAAVDSLGNQSPVREVTLPQLSIGVAENTVLRRGLIEKLKVEMTSPGSLTVDSLELKVGSNDASNMPGPFDLTANQPYLTELYVATSLDALVAVPVRTTAVLTPAPGTEVILIKSLLVDVTASNAALEIFNEPLVRGTESQVQLKINNLGTARMDVVTSENSGASSQVLVRMQDQDGNLLAEGRLDQRSGALVYNSSGFATARIEPGQTFLTAPITFVVPDNAPTLVQIEAEITNTYYHYGQAEQVNAPGLSQSIETSIINVSYATVAQVAKDVYLQGEQIEISGQATLNATGDSATYVPVVLGISVDGFDRSYTVSTDETGAFRYIFKPASNEAGTYSVWASHPDFVGRSVQDRFDIIGLWLNPAAYNLRMSKNKVADVPFSLTNLGGAPIQEVVFAVDASSGFSASLLNSGDPVLAGDEARKLNLRIVAAADAPENGYVNVDITTGPGLHERFIVNVSAYETLPMISTTPSYIDTGLMRGKQQIQSLTIVNKGLGILENARIEGPSTAWMSLMVDPVIGSLNVGQSATVGLLFRPPETLTPGIYDDRFVIYSDNHIPYTFNIQVTVTSSAVGNAQFNVLNELYEDVANATIILQHQVLPELFYTLKTGTDGSILKSDIPEGRYSYMVTASAHKSYSGSFVVYPGLTVTVPVALEVTLIEIEWSVTEITIEDRYEITISQTFETNVPASVLVVDPPGITLPDMAPGEVLNGEFTITNHGLISADYKSMNYPSTFDQYELEVLGNIPTTFGPYEKIIIPY